MTIYTAEEIEALKESIKFTDRPDGSIVSYAKTQATNRKAAQTLLELITNKHPDYVVVPREPTQKMLHYLMEKWDFIGNLNIASAMHSNYTAVIQAAQKGKE